LFSAVIGCNLCHPFKAKTRVQIPLGTLFSEKYLAKWPHRIPSPRSLAGPTHSHAATEIPAIFSRNHDADATAVGVFVGATSLKMSTRSDQAQGLE
jgi:hypothetical protein